jgi:Family of unknown function (DUF6504)
VRRYDDPVDVRRGPVAGPGEDQGPGGTLLVEGPEQFLWRGRLWRVSAVVAHWVETGAWWQSPGADAARGLGAAAGPGRAATSGAADLTAEREVWRVQADRGMSSARLDGCDGSGGPGVFDLVLDWTDGSWRLTRCLD